MGKLFGWRGFLRHGLPVVVVLTTGCVTFDKPYVSKDTYMLAAVRPGPPAESVRSHSILKVRAVPLMSLAQHRAFVYRRTDERWEMDYYNQFILPPGPMLCDIVRQWMSDSGLLGWVTDASSLLVPSYVVEVGIADLYADYRPGVPARAVVGLTFALLDNATPPRVLFQGRYREEVPLDELSPVGLVRAWNAGVGACLVRFEEEVCKSVY